LADVNRVHEWAQEQGKTETEVGQTISQRLAALVHEIITRCPPSGLIIAGGETSGTICREFCFDGLRVGANIEPGVPLCITMGELELPVVLKSGNFGSTDFFGKAIQAIHQARKGNSL